MITIRYFARLREQLNLDAEELSLPAEVETVGELRQHLAGRGSPWSDALADGAMIMAAVNQGMARLDTKIRSGDEIAFFPPVTGG